MKGIELIGELITFIALIILGYLLGGAIVYLDREFHIIDVIPGGGEGKFVLIVNASTLPIKHEDAMLAFLESTYTVGNTEIPIKKLIAASLAQNTTQIYLNGRQIDMKTVSANKLTVWEGEHGFLLRLKSQSNKLKILFDSNAIAKFIAGRDFLRIQVVKAKIKSPFEIGDLEMWVS